MKIKPRAVAVAVFLLSAIAQAKDVRIKILNHAFIPVMVTVQSGTRVTWTNEDEDPHTVVEKENAFHSAALDTRDTFSFIFTRPGTFAYFCSLHPMMVGSIWVVGKKPLKKHGS